MDEARERSCAASSSVAYRAASLSKSVTLNPLPVARSTSQYPALNPWSLLAAGAIVSLMSFVAASSWSGSPSNLVTRANISFLPNFVLDVGRKPTPGIHQTGAPLAAETARGRGSYPDYAVSAVRTRPSDDAELVEGAIQIGGVAVDAKRAGSRQLIP